MTFDLVPTSIVAGVALMAVVFCGWRGSKPAPLMGAPRMVPWRFLMLAAAVVVLVALVHIVALIRGPGAA